MQEQPWHDQGLPHAAVVPITDDGMADRGQVDTDLVGPAGLQLAAQQGEVRWSVVAGPDLVARAGRSSSGHHGLARGLARRTADRGVDHPARRLGHAPDEGRVASLDPAVPERGDERGVRRRRQGHHQEAGGVPVEPMDDAGAVGLADLRQLRVSGQQPVDQGALALTSTRVHDQPGRLVDHDHVGVLVDDVHGDAGVRSRWGLGGKLPEVDGQRLSRGDALPSGGDHRPVDPDRARSDERRRLAPAATGDEADNPVHPLTVERGRDLLKDRLAHRPGRLAVRYGRPAASPARGSRRRS